MKTMANLMIILMFFMSTMNNPLLMVLIILLQTISISYLIMYMYMTFWVSYILILIFLGGMLVIFIYIASLTKIEEFSLKLNFFKKMMFLGMILFILNMHDYELYFLSTKMSLFQLKMSTPLMSMTNMYNNNMMYTTLILAIYLMLTLLIIVKICNFNKIPLKKK